MCLPRFSWEPFYQPGRFDRRARRLVWTRLPGFGPGDWGSNPHVPASVHAKLVRVSGQVGLRKHNAEPCLPSESDVDFALDIVPFSRFPEARYELVERGRVGGRVLEPRQEVEGLAKVATMIETSGDCREVLEADCDMMRVLFENRSSFVLGQLPP